MHFCKPMPLVAAVLIEGGDKILSSSKDKNLSLINGLIYNLI